MNTRDEIASRIMAGICAGDWQIPLPEGKTWDDMASKRAYEIADAMLRERDITTISETHQRNVQT